MVSLTTYIKGEIKVILFTELRGKEHVGEWSEPKDKSDSVILKELKAVNLGLSHINRPVDLEIYVGHPWVVTALNSWAKQWQQNEWKKSNGKPIENKELWETIMDKLDQHKYVARLKG